MNLHKVFATTKRVLTQLRHDPRTLALIFFVPCILITILKYVFNGQPAVFDSIAPMILGVFPLTVMFVVTSVAMLRERTVGTLDRLMTMPIAKIEFVAGYAAAFSLLAFIQALLASFVVFELLGVSAAAGVGPLLLGAVLSALLGMAMGLFLSAFATSEFQAVQFLPAFVLPQLLVCGLFVPRDAMATALQWFADIMPLTYSVDAMKLITTQSSWSGQLTRDFIVVAGFGLIALVLGAATIRRKE